MPIAVQIGGPPVPVRIEQKHPISILSPSRSRPDGRLTDPSGWAHAHTPCACAPALKSCAVSRTGEGEGPRFSAQALSVTM